MNKTEISYLTHNWSPIVGCTHSGSPGCTSCWARELHNRRHKAALSGKPMPEQYAKPFDQIQFFPKRLTLPLKVKKPARVGICFQADLFHKNVTISDQEQIFRVMISARQHTFFILTKRADQMQWRIPIIMNRIFGSPDNWRMPENLWLGVSVEDPATADERITPLLETPAAHRWASYEPALWPLDLLRYLEPFKDRDPMLNREPRLEWIVCGGESGPKARACDIAWIRSIVQQCEAASVPCFVKQLGGKPVGKDPLSEPIRNLWYAEEQLYHYVGLNRSGSNAESWPEDLRVRQLPEGV